MISSHMDIFTSKSNRWAIGILCFCLAIYICKVAEVIIMPFVVAVFVWYLINAIARFLKVLGQKSGFTLPAFVRFSAAILCLCSVALFITQMVNYNLDTLITEAPKFQASFKKIVVQGIDFVGLADKDSAKQMINQILTEYIDIGVIIRHFVAMLTGLAGSSVIVVMFVGFLLYEQRFFDRKITALLSNKENETRVRDILETIDNKIQRYIGVKTFVSFTDSCLTYFILSYFHVDFAGFWGVMAFFLHFIPYAGSFVAISMPCLIALIQFGDLTVFASVLVCLSISHAFLGHILDPYLMGNNLNLSPIFIITNLAIWGMIWGVPGMFLAIPLLAIAVITFGQFEHTRPIAVLFSKTGILTKRKTGRLEKYRAR